VKCKHCCEEFDRPIVDLDQEDPIVETMPIMSLEEVHIVKFRRWGNEYVERDLRVHKYNIRIIPANRSSSALLSSP
jgi:hypothetical protein